jgi:creatinine amidohydrolase/Fe(II)-dependent formamide hydrolase-like protein
MQLHQASWPEVEAYLKRSTGIVIPIGSTEQHGPNGLIGTDALCPEIIAREAGAEAGFLVGPTFNVGVAQHHLGFPGSITLRPSTMIAALSDWIDSLSRHGFTRIYFLNGHGGNIATIAAAFAESYAAWSLDGEACPYRLKQDNWFSLPGVGDVCKSIFPVGEGSHATASEVSVTYYAYPEAAKSVAMSPKIAPEGGFTDAADYRARFPDGRIGSDPSQATADKGERITAAARTALIREVEAFFTAP